MPLDVARLPVRFGIAAFLAGQHADFINGTDILIDGGVHIGLAFGTF